MVFVRENTSIPVPKVYAVFERKGHAHIVMEKISGNDIGTGWYRRSEESKLKLFSQLKAYVEELRSLAPPPNVGVAALHQSPLYDQRLSGSSDHGPFESVQEFHRYLRNGIDASHVAASPYLTGDLSAEMLDLISFHDDYEHGCEEGSDSVVFTHSDLSSFNILARGDTITGIIDWETAGWLPKYWEYTTAWNANPQNQWWQDEVDNFLVPDPRAREADVIRRKYFGDF